MNIFLSFSPTEIIETRSELNIISMGLVLFSGCDITRTLQPYLLVNGNNSSVYYSIPACAKVRPNFGTCLQ